MMGSESANFDYGVWIRFGTDCEFNKKISSRVLGTENFRRCLRNSGFAKKSR